uniref:Uncharacterized protein n=1 Tax=Physcomitrium patens TaxID=3218 RepID=A9U028_PHYPA|nr:hypothetical protein PHYPA_017856 [Physcomitrium patens]
MTDLLMCKTSRGFDFLNRFHPFFQKSEARKTQRYAMWSFAEVRELPISLVTARAYSDRLHTLLENFGVNGFTLLPVLIPHHFANQKKMSSQSVGYESRTRDHLQICKSFTDRHLRAMSHRCALFPKSFFATKSPPPFYSAVGPAVTQAGAHAFPHPQRSSADVLYFGPIREPIR